MRLGNSRIREIPRPSFVTIGASIDWKTAKSMGLVRIFADKMKNGKLPIWTSRFVEIQMDWFATGQRSGVYDWNRSRAK